LSPQRAFVVQFRAGSAPWTGRVEHMVSVAGGTLSVCGGALGLYGAGCGRRQRRGV